jgi:thioredoxin reductase (NADPH)
MENIDLVIIGGGPAGLAAGIYAARSDLKAVLLERGMPGGLAASTELIENYPGFPDGVGGPELAMQMDAQARRFGLDIRSVNAESIQPADRRLLVHTDDGILAARSIILATGAQPSKLGVPGEGKFHGRGVSYCATCDGAFFRDKIVAVVGGGDAAVEEGLYLTKFADKVYIIHRRDSLRATKILQRRAMENNKIEFCWNSVVEEILGEGLINEVRLKNVKTGAIRPLQVDGVFIYVGLRPSTDLVRDLVKLDKLGYVITDDHMETSHPGIFAAGDVRSKSLRQVVTAAADGAIAAMAAEKYLEQLEWLE